MAALKYKIGDKVQIKSLNWYNTNKNADGFVLCGCKVFDDYMSVFCGSVVTIGGVSPYNGYDIREDMQCRTWTDEMIENKISVSKPQNPSRLSALERGFIDNIISTLGFLEEEDKTLCYTDEIELLKKIRLW